MTTKLEKNQVWTTQHGAAEVIVTGVKDGEVAYEMFAAASYEMSEEEFRRTFPALSMGAQEFEQNYGDNVSADAESELECPLEDCCQSEPCERLDEAQAALKAAREGG